MRYKKGDKVKVKSLDWYKANKNSKGAVNFHNLFFFDELMSEFCGKVVTIDAYIPRGNYYAIKEDEKADLWTDDMFEGLAIEEPQDKMVSLDKVCDMLYAMLTTQDINDYDYVTAPAYDNVEDFVEDFRKSMEK
jgi:hypothetical protein